MASFTDRVSILVDVVTGNAKGELGKLTNSVKDADGVMGKAKAGAGSLFSTITSSAPLAAGAVGGMAVATISAVESLIGPYTDLSEQVRKFAQVSGQTAEQSSKWVAFGNEVGVSADQLDGAFGKLGKTLGNTPDALAKFGVTATKTKDGAVDLGATFLDVTAAMSAMTDPAEQAALGTAAFGKSWQAIIPIVDRGTDATKQLADATGHIFSAGELAANEQYTQTMAKLSATVDDLKMKVAQSMIPTLASAADAVEKVAGPLDKLTSSVGGLGSALEIGFRAFSPLGWATDVIDVTDKVGSKIGDMLDSGPSKSEKSALAISGDYKAMAQAAFDSAARQEAVSEQTNLSMQRDYQGMADAANRSGAAQEAAMKAAADHIAEFGRAAAEKSLVIPIEFSLPNGLDLWTKYQQEWAALVNSGALQPLQAPMFIGVTGIGGSGLTATDQVALSNGVAALGAAYTRRNGTTPK